MPRVVVDHKGISAEGEATVKVERHPVGFTKFVLGSLGGRRVRLHVWRGGHGNDSRHNHRWAFISVPLIGRFVETRYTEQAGHEFVKISVADNNGHRDTERLYRCRSSSNLEIASVKTRYPLLPYICRVGEVHSLVPYGAGFHASLVLTGRVRRGRSDIWRYPDAIDVDISRDARVDG